MLQCDQHTAQKKDGVKDEIGNDFAPHLNLLLLGKWRDGSINSSPVYIVYLRVWKCPDEPLPEHQGTRAFSLEYQFINISLEMPRTSRTLLVTLQL